MSFAALSRSLPWIGLALCSAITLGVTGCSSDSTRISDRIFDTNSARPSGELAGAIQPRPAPSVNSTTLPPPAAQVAPGTSSVVPPPAPRVAASEPTKPVNSPATPPARNLPPHTVVSGDTLQKIARQYNVSLSELRSANSIATTTKLKVGSQLSIPPSRPIQSPPPKVVASAKPSENPPTNNVHKITPTPDLSAESKNPTGTTSLTFRWPVRGRVIAGFGPRPSGLENQGVNFAVPEGTPVKAAEDGVVIYANSELKTFGNLLLIRHNNGFVTAYAHCSEILVRKDELVKRGQVIAKSGQTGNVSSPQLHFQIRKGPVPVDPMIYLERSPQA